MTAITAQQRWKRAYSEARYWPLGQSRDVVLRRALFKFFGHLFPPAILRTFAASPVTAAGAVDWSQWFDHCWVAKGASSLSASYADLVGSQALSAGTAPVLDADGWSFDGTQWLDTGIIPPSGGTLMVGFENGTESGGQGIVGSIKSGYFALGSYWYGDAIYFGNGNQESAASPKMLSGVLAFSGLKVFRNGVHSHTMTGWNLVGTLSYYIGGIHVDAGILFTYTGTIRSVGIATAALSDGNMADAYSAMAAL